jgi:prephenate dehydrogenase
LLFERATVIGIGMMGGSFALAAKQGGLVGSIVGVARTEPTLRQARRLGAADETTTDPVAAVSGAELVYLAAPVGAIPGLLRTIAPAVPEGCLLTDAGSTKRHIMAAAADLRPHCTFVGGHPLAGSEQAGVAAARPDLFRGCSYFLTPDPGGKPDALGLLRRLVEGLGAKPVLIDADAHDRLMAATSHLPHMLAAALCATLADAEGDLAPFAGPGLRDTTRIALGSPELWRDILLTNADNVRNSLAELRRTLDDFERALRVSDPQRLSSLLEGAREFRKRLVE